MNNSNGCEVALISFDYDFNNDLDNITAIILAKIFTL